MIFSPIWTYCVWCACLTRLPDHQNGGKENILCPPLQEMKYQKPTMDSKYLLNSINNSREDAEFFFIEHSAFCGQCIAMLGLSEMHISQTPYLNFIFWTFNVFWQLFWESKNFPGSMATFMLFWKLFGHPGKSTVALEISKC